MMYRSVLVCALVLCAALPAFGQTKEPAGSGVPDDFVIGVADVLDVTFWRDEKMSGEAVVRPDGKITLSLLNEIQAAGLTTAELRQSLEKAAAKFLTDPTVGVTVKAINSRRVSILGAVANQGAYSIVQPTTVAELITMAGGFADWANRKDIRIIRTLENGEQVNIRFNYNDFVSGRNMEQNILLQPGDIVNVKD